jgi:serine/threonine protein kinase
MIGKIINNYVIERKLGGGGMGDVYYAKHNKVDREVAIKVLHSHLFSNESIHNRFKNEANALIKLNHPNIVKIFDYVEQETFACLIMEYVNGYTLDDYISKLTGPLPSVKASSIICSILDAVQYAHDNNVYHRDIKPANIMINKEGNRVLIMDFGIAKLTDSKNFKTTHANTQLGTPFYMSPEQIKGLPYSRMSDIYSLGVTLFEMVTGKCPYHQITSLYELQSKIVNEPLPQTSDYYPGVSIKIQNAIIKATQKTPELRFQSCNEFKLYLHEKDNTITPSPPPKIISVHQTKGSLNWTAYIIAGFVLIIVIILATVFLPQNTGNEREIQYPIVPDTSKTIVSKNSILPLADSISIQDQNKVILDTYLKRKQRETNKTLSAKQLMIFNHDVQAIKEITSDKELSIKFDRYFEGPTVTILSESKILNDFWNELHKRQAPCRTILENDNQITGVNIVNPPKKTLNTPSKIYVNVNFTIASSDDETDKTDCSVTLKYIRSGNEYILSK